MIETRHGNMFDVDTGIIVHGCNCLGAMGAGVALEVKNRYPDAYHVYMTAHRAGQLKLGEISVAEVAPFKFIVNALTQQGVGGPVRNVSYDAVADAFEKVAKLAEAIKTHRNHDLEIIFPMIGAGLGGGRWDVISGIIDAVVPDVYKKVLYLYDKKENQ